MLVDDILGAAEEVATFCAHFPVELRAQIGEGRVTQVRRVTIYLFGLIEIISLN